MKRYIIVCDESTRKGKKYSYFYGGAIIEEKKYQKINEILALYSSLKQLGEVKRTKITAANYRYYIELLDIFFNFIRTADVKARVMFCANKDLDILPKAEDETYSKFYYLFIRHAFSIYYIQEDISLRLIFDELPETKVACLKFKTFLVKYLNVAKGANSVSLVAKDIEEVDSKKHMILQCMDAIMGLVDFALNSSAEDRKSIRGKAKWEVWKFVLKKIQAIHPSFCIHATTYPLKSKKGWEDGYKHFVYTKRNK